MRAKDNNLPYYLAFSYKAGIGPYRLKELIENYGSIKAAYEAEIKDFDVAKVLQELKNKNITLLSREDPRYPPQLLTISDAPICLYVKGDLERFDFNSDLFFSIVGTRRPSSYGRQIGYKLASELSMAGAVIVSGMAAGIDAIAHQAALDNNGKTIAVLGGGVDKPYPSSNIKLYEQIINRGGAVISEFPPGMQGLKGLFVARNRIVSALSRGVLVVEGTKTSGSLITARLAAQQGREVFAVPGPVTSEMSEAPNILLKEGAHLTRSTEDILSVFNMQIVPSNQKQILEGLSPDERKITETLLKEPKFIDELVVELGYGINSILNTLSILEIKGIIEKNQEGRYQLSI